jgi:deoxyribose-phosphate aldolase
MNTPINLASYIDHTLLKATATPSDIAQLCLEAKTHQFKAVCVNPIYVAQAKKTLEGTGVLVATVCGFPLGAITGHQKALEAAESLRLGADEIDMVVHIGGVLAGDWDVIADELAVVRAATVGSVLKVIVEMCLLEEHHKIKVTELVLASGADFIKTSTGFSTGGATVPDVQLFKSIVGDQMQIKAAGGIRNHADALEMIAAGANRLGTSGGVAIVAGQTLEGGY